MHDSGCGQVLIIKHVLCVTPGNEHKCINTSGVPDLYMAFVSVKTYIPYIYTIPIYHTNSVLTA